MSGQALCNIYSPRGAASIRTVLVLQCAMLLLQCVVSYFSARCKLLRFYFSTTPHFYCSFNVLFFYLAKLQLIFLYLAQYYIFHLILLLLHCNFFCFLLFTVCPFCLCVLPLFCVCVFFLVWTLGVWGELASHKRLFNPPPQFSRLGT